jgi:outer membrane protein assembly factor BamB
MQRPAYILLTTLILLLSLPGLTANAGDWSRWRGPHGNGTSAEAGWSPEAINNGSAVVWRGNVGRGHSSISISGDRLYTMGARDLDVAGEALYEEVVYCLDATTGREIWRYPYQTRLQGYHGPGATPVLDGDRLLSVGRDGYVISFDAATGAVQWRRNLISENLSTADNWGFHGSVVVDGDLVIVNAGQSGVALDKSTGKVVWASEPATGGQATPVLFNLNGKRLAAIAGNGRLHVVDVATGEVQWHHRWAADTDPTIIGSRMLLVGGRAARGSVLLEMSEGNPQELWRSRALAGSFQTGAVHDNHAYRLNRSSLECSDIKTGELQWSQSLGDYGDLLIADGKLVIVSGDGYLIIAEASPESYTEISRTKLFNLKPIRSYEPGQPNACWTVPAFANGRIYARSSWGDIACIEVG